MSTDQMIGAERHTEDGSLYVTEVTTQPASSTSGATGNVSASATSVTLAAANASRRALIIFNDSVSSMYYQFGATASASGCVDKIASGGTLYLVPCPYNGIVTGIWDSATGTARVTEL